MPKRFETQRERRGVAREKVVAVPAKSPIIEKISIVFPAIPSVCLPNIDLQLSDILLVFAFLT